MIYIYEKIIKIYYTLNAARGKKNIDYTLNMNLLRDRIPSQTDANGI